MVKKGDKVINIYDLLLNFQNNYYEFFEWDNDDEIIHIKKINIMKISSDDYDTLLNKKVIIDTDLLLSIFNKCEYYNNKKIFTIPYALLFTDSYRVMGVVINMDGKIIKYSSLELLDEEDILNISERLAICKIKYNVIGDRVMEYNKTREEIEIIEYIKNDLKESLLNKNYDKLKYLYYEYFGRECNDFNKIKKDFNKELTCDINKKHYNLYNLIKLSRQVRRV